MYPNIAVIELFTLDGIRFALITDAAYEELCNACMRRCSILRKSMFGKILESFHENVLN